MSFSPHMMYLHEKSIIPVLLQNVICDMRKDFSHENRLLLKYHGGESVLTKLK